MPFLPPLGIKLVGFYIPLDTYIIGHLADESFQAIDSVVLSGTKVEKTRWNSTQPVVPVTFDLII